MRRLPLTTPKFFLASFVPILSVSYQKDTHTNKKANEKKGGSEMSPKAEEKRREISGMTFLTMSVTVVMCELVTRFVG